MNRKLKAPAQLFGKFSRFTRLSSLFSAHAQRLSQYDLEHMVLAKHALQPGKVTAFILPFQRFQALSRNSQRIGDGEPHSPGAVIDGQNAAGEFHAAIIRSAASDLVQMATNRIVPPPPDQPSPQLVRDDNAAEAELQQVRKRKFRNTLRAGAVAELVLGIIAVLVVCYVAKTVLITLLVSVLIAFTLEPLVSLLQRWRLPRSAAAFIAVLLLCGLVWAGSYFFYNRAVSFAHELPRYSQKIRGKLARITKQTSDIRQTTQQILPGQAQQNKNAVPVKVENSGGASEFFTKGLGTVTEVLAAVAFIPFLVYFMLSWQEHARTKTVQLFRPENRTTAYVTLGQISLMIRSFIAGNFIIGLFMSAVSTAVFGGLGLPYFYFLGLLSGFLSLMPYLGVILAAVPPLAAGLGTLKETGMIIVVLTVLGLHLFSMNVLYPKVIGKRLQLNPLLVTIALLVWGWIWGALGLILAVPVMGVIKIVCDHVATLRPLGEWMGE